MFTYAKQYVTALGVVLLAMLVYRWTVAVSIEPTGQDKVKPVVFKNTLHTTQWWKQLFAADSWQQSEPKVLQTPRGILLFKNWTQLGPDQWRLEPLTMIIPQTDSMPAAAQSSDASQSLTEQDVWIVNAEQGAVIQFREAFDWTKGSTPPVIGGRLEGRINITRRAKEISDDRPWMLTTSDVRIDRRHISTIKPVEIRWDNSVIRGRDLSIFLKQDLLSDSQDDASPWGVLETMELIYVEEINVGLPPGGLWADMKRSSPQLPVVQGLPAQLRLESGGPFRFDFVTSQAQLMNGVHAIHQLGSLAPDQFWSQELQVKLTPELPGTSKTSDASKTAIKVGGLQLKQLTARGMDPVGPINGQTLVRLDAPNIGAAARAKRLNVNFLDHQLELSGRLESPQAVSTVATLDYLGYSFRSPLIQYRQDPAAEHLGWLAADGPGELQVAADSKMGQCNVRWQKSMRMKPDGNEQWISLAGKTLVESAVHGFLTSDSLDIWLKPSPANAAKQVVAPESPSAASATTASFVPDRMRAIGAVTIASQQIKANVNELNLWLVHSTPNAGNNAEAGNLSLSDSAGNPMYQFVSPPAAGNSENAQTNAGTVMYCHPTSMRTQPTCHRLQRCKRPSIRSIAAILMGPSTSKARYCNQRLSSLINNRGSIR